MLTKAIAPVEIRSAGASAARYSLHPACSASFALLTEARAVTPSPGGGYPNANTTEGEDALFSLDTRIGWANTAIGFNALYSTTDGLQNTAVGAYALAQNTSGFGNTAVGDSALAFNTTGSYNTATGEMALTQQTGSNNTADGANALGDATGSNNTATGSFAMWGADSGFTSGNNNTADGAPLATTGITTWPTGFRRSIATQAASGTRLTVFSAL